MVVKKPDTVDELREKLIEAAGAIIDSNKNPTNEMQIEALKVALEMYKTCKG